MQSLPDVRNIADSVDNFIKKTIERITDSWSMASYEFDSASDELEKVPQNIQNQMEQKIQDSLDSAKDNLSGNVEELTEKQKDLSRQKLIESLKKEDSGSSQDNGMENSKHSEKIKHNT